MSGQQLLLQWGPLRNSDLFSSHWLENRLSLEPEWTELKDQAREVLDGLLELWGTQRNRVDHYGDEQGLEQAFIQPVLERLHWKLKYQTFLQGRKPDYALFIDDESLDSALQAGRTSPEFWKYPTLVADAKAWYISLDRPSTVQNQKEYPPQQIEWYLDRSRLGFAILTNGKLWRLIPRDYGLQQRRFQTYLEFNLANFLESWISSRNIVEQSTLFNDFLCFFLFFSPTAFETIDGRKSLIVRAIEGSSEYRIGVGEGLKDRTFEALRLCIQGFLEFMPNALSYESDLTLCRQQSFILLYRLLFIMYAEDRRLLPYRVNRTYTNNRSLGKLRDEITGRLERIREGREPDYSRESTDMYSGLMDLFDLVDGGHKTYGVPEYNGGLFDPDEHPFLAEKQVSDFYLSRIIDQLGNALDPERPELGLFRVDYHDLAIQHLGSIYEGLLELNPRYATEKMIIVSRKVQGRSEEKIIPASTPMPNGFQMTSRSYSPGTIYLVTNKGERRASGSYYTPDHIVDYIVQQTLGPLCTAISNELRAEIEAVQQQIEIAGNIEREQLDTILEKLRHDFDDRILRLRVLDPAMGSGHFLIRACQYLAEWIATDPNTGDDAVITLSDESSLTFWKRRVAERCLYGVDMNEMAVELAKLALWLETVAADKPLTFLDHHLHYGNSLIGAKITELGALPGEIEIVKNTFISQVEEQLPALLEPLAAIRQAPSETAEQVKAKQKLNKAFEKAREPFRQVADLWASAFVKDGSKLTPGQYQSALDVITKQTKFKKITEEFWFQDAVSLAQHPNMVCFHWELEFPEVFFDDKGRLTDTGFDAIIGNPPYDVLSEAETGRDLSTLRSFIENEPIYEPSRRGKNNLYKLFICRALELLAEGGYMGFITPMAVLGDDQAADIRRKIVEVGSFTGIEAFPQKDDPNRRVFPEAKLSTAVFTMVKGRSGDGDSFSFTSHVHPGRFIESNSPSLSLTTDSIPLYDPANFTIVSCSQADWDLATRIIHSGRMSRLGQFCTSYQGEVNEFNEKKSLSIDIENGPLILRGASICLYTIRDASQGKDYFLREKIFLKGKSPTSKAFHSRFNRVGFQRSSPQNNFRRIIATIINAGNYCFDTVSYVPSSTSKLPLPFLVGLLNSKLLDWYFRLGSTNSKVNEYQFNNLPCPVFLETLKADERSLRDNILAALEAKDFGLAYELVKPLLLAPPFSMAVQDIIVEAVNRITAIEVSRGDIPRTARSALAPAAQPYQDLIDRLFYAMAGLTAQEAADLEERLVQML